MKVDIHFADVDILKEILMDIATIKAQIENMRADAEQQKTIVLSTAALLDGQSAINASLRAEVEALKKQVADGSAVTQQQLQDLSDTMKTVDTQLDESRAALLKATMANTPTA